MIDFRASKLLGAVLAAVLLLAGFPGRSFADPAADAAALKEQIRVMKQQIDELNKQVDNLAKKQQEQAAAKPAPTPGAGPPEPKFEAFAKEYKEKGAEPKLATFMKGFFGTLNASIDYTTKGMSDMVAYHFGSAPDGGPPYPNNGAKSPPGPYGRVSWLAAMSSNGSNVGYRGQQKVGTSNVDFIYQVSTSLNMVAAPGLQNTWTKSSNTVQGAIGLGDTYLGFQGKDWGKVKFGDNADALPDQHRPTESLREHAG